MKPDKLDIKIQEAAAQNESVYNEQAWSAMEKLLDEEMPQKKKDKKKILWLFLLLFVVTGSALLIMRPWGNTEQVAVSVKNAPTNGVVNDHDKLLPDLTAGSHNNDKNTILSPLPEHDPVSQKLLSEKSVKSNIRRKAIVDKMPGRNKLSNSDPENIIENESNIERQVPTRDKNDGAQLPDNSQVAIGITEKDSAGVNENNIVDKKENGYSVIKENNPDTILKKITSRKRGNKFINSFALNFSVGPDVSAVNIDNVGKVKYVYGVGISYEINKKLAVRTGFYVARKVYDAKASDYHPPARFWNYYPNLKYIDADCKIYEVPLIINYNFSQTLKHQWFGSVGISSFFMKKEDYSYFSKTPSGQNSYDSYSVANKSRHYLSSLRLSVGYQKELGNNNISLITEPYINLPLSGVGYGKVKLYSAGVLFSLSVKSFSKK